MDRDDLFHAVLKAVDHHGGEATIVEVAKYIWDNHEAELRASGNLFFTWQYEMRWASQRLRHENKLALGHRNGRSTWRKV